MEAEAARKRANDEALRKVLELERESNERLMWGIEEVCCCCCWAAGLLGCRTAGLLLSCFLLLGCC